MREVIIAPGNCCNNVSQSQSPLTILYQSQTIIKSVYACIWTKNAHTVDLNLTALDPSSHTLVECCQVFVVIVVMATRLHYSEIILNVSDLHAITNLFIWKGMGMRTLGYVLNRIKSQQKISLTPGWYQPYVWNLAACGSELVWE